MTQSFFKRIAPHAVKLAAISLFAFGVSGCGGGSGDGSEDTSKQPAPQTFNGLVFSLYSQGPAFTCIRAEGDAMTGVETGAVEMTPASANTRSVDSSGASVALIPSSSISGARYTYVRTGPESGTLTIEGASSGISLIRDPDSTESPKSNYLGSPEVSNFRRTYFLLFGTDGSSISGVNANDVGESDDETFLISYPGINWSNPTLRLYSGGSVPIGWNLQQSLGVGLPKIYPDGVNRERFEITPANVADPQVGYQFLNSTFTRFSSAIGDFIEEGVGNKDVQPDPTLTLINFDYQPDPQTTNRARIRIYEGSKPVVIYDMTFLDFEKGTYVREDGSTGTFEFPFLD